MEADMIRIKVEYDKYNRAFKLLDHEFGSVLQDGIQYELIVPLGLEGEDPEKDDDDLLFVNSTNPLAHA